MSYCTSWGIFCVSNLICVYAVLVIPNWAMCMYQVHHCWFVWQHQHKNKHEYTHDNNCMHSNISFLLRVQTVPTLCGITFFTLTAEPANTVVMVPGNTCSCIFKQSKSNFSWKYSAIAFEISNTHCLPQRWGKFGVRLVRYVLTQFRASFSDISYTLLSPRNILLTVLLYCV